MRQIVNEMKRQSQAVLADVALPQTGIVRNYDPAKYQVRVELQPQGNLTGWIPLLSPWVGNGWGLTCPPTVGDLVEVIFLNGDIDAASAGMRFYNDTDIPLTTPSGEFWLVHASGAFLKLLNNGSATITDGKGATMTLNGDGTITSTAIAWNHVGPLNVAGTVTATIDVFGGGKSLKTHMHSGVQSGGSNTGAPV